MVESGEGRSSGQPTASQRKRERDRLNQRNKRQREREQVTALESRIQHLEQELLNARLRHHGSPQTQIEPQSAHRDLAAGWSGNVAIEHLHSWRTWAAQSTVIGNSSSSKLIVTLPLEPLDKLLAIPDWLRLPLLTFSILPAPRLLLHNEKFGSIIEHLRSTPNIAKLLPPSPKVLDLLFGGSRNELANLIVSALAPYPVLPPEKFAIAWLLYLFFRWYIAPSQETYLAIPKHMRPTTCQLFLEHPVYIVALLWPGLRDQLVLHWRKYNLENVFGLLSCTVRVRASFNGNFVTRENDGEPQVDDRFYKRFMQEDGWGLLERFWTEYPELVEGLDRDIMIGEEHLLPP